MYCLTYIKENMQIRYETVQHIQLSSFCSDLLIKEIIWIMEDVVSGEEGKKLTFE